MKTNYGKKLQREREKLNNLVDEALKNGTPISKTYAIMEQCAKISRMTGSIKNGILQNAEIQKQSRRVDDLIVRVEKEKE